MGSSRRVGINENIQTFGAAGQGRDYTAMNIWEGDTDIDLVSAAQSEILECYDDSASFNTYAVLAGATTSPSYRRVIRAASGEGHNGTGTTGFHIIRTTSNAMTVDEANSQAQDLIITMDINTASTRSCGVIQEDEGGLVGIIACNSANAGSGVTNGFYLLAANDVYVINCLAENNDNDGFLRKYNAVNANLFNCTSLNNAGYGFAWDVLDQDQSICKNCLADNNTSGDFESGGYTGSEYNASGDTSAPGTNSRTNQTFTFVDSDNDDYHLDAADAGAKDYGKDLSADSAYAFDDDIDFETISTWSIGFDSIISADLSINVNDCTDIVTQLI
jgi:hypothetical protein